MSLKRPNIPNVYPLKKKFKSIPHLDNSEVNETEIAIKEIKNLFPTEAFEGRLPPIVLKHQLYNIVKNKTQCDKELGILRDEKKVKLFKIGNDAEEFAVLFTEDYCAHVLKLYSSPIVENFLDKVVRKSSQISCTKDELIKSSIHEKVLQKLMSFGLLTIRDVNSWWLAIPRAGEFMKTFIKGRRHLLLMIRKAKYGEILYRDLLQRKLHKDAKLGLVYHIHDVIGSELVKCIDSTSGSIIRLNES